MIQPSNERQIVVGADGPASAKATPARAIKEARLTGAVVEAVTVRQFPATHSHPLPVVPGTDLESARR